MASGHNKGRYCAQNVVNSEFAVNKSEFESKQSLKSKCIEKQSVKSWADVTLKANLRNHCTQATKHTDQKQKYD